MTRRRTMRSRSGCAATPSRQAHATLHITHAAHGAGQSCCYWVPCQTLSTCVPHLWLSGMCWLCHKLSVSCRRWVSCSGTLRNALCCRTWEQQRTMRVPASTAASATATGAVCTSSYLAAAAEPRSRGACLRSFVLMTHLPAQALSHSFGADSRRHNSLLCVQGRQDRADGR
jgi:hypothetical protein